MVGVDRYELGERLRGLRTTSGKTLDDVARALNVTRSAVSLWESGEREPRATTFLQYLKEVGAPSVFSGGAAPKAKSKAKAA